MADQNPLQVKQVASPGPVVQPAPTPQATVPCPVPAAAQEQPTALPREATQEVQQSAPGSYAEMARSLEGSGKALKITSVAVGMPFGSKAALRWSGGGWQFVVQTTEGQKEVDVPSAVVEHLKRLADAATPWAVPLDNAVGLSGGYVAGHFNGEIEIGITKLPNGKLAIPTIKGQFVARELADTTGTLRTTVLTTDVIDRNGDKLIVEPFHPSRESQVQHQDNVLRLPGGETLRIYCLQERTGKVRFALYGDLVLYMSGEAPFLRSYEVDAEYLGRFPETVAGALNMSFKAATDYVVLLYQAQGRRILDGTILPVYRLPRAELNPGDQPNAGEQERLMAAERLAQTAEYRRETEKGALSSWPNYLNTIIWTKGQVLLEDFVIEGELGKGGMGVVYLMRNQSMGQQFAVKKTLFNNPESRRAFLRELQTWIDLPEHPHLVACRFFRTLGDQVVIFADYVEGGSLAEWINQRRLDGVEQILDVAIQFAWGLHAAHERGLIHQDVKPANVLMTVDGVAKVSDFGLARARAGAGERAGSSGQSILVSAGGMTPAYCSPEQARGQPLSRRTDVWSWGLSILEMFTGGVTWLSGSVASEVLEDYLTSGTDDRRLPAMPPALAEVLRRCFRQDPEERWPTMSTLAAALEDIHRKALGKEYPRRLLESPEREVPVPGHDRHGVWGIPWTDPKQWLLRAFVLEGRDPASVDAVLPPRGGSRKAQEIADLAAFEEARRIIETLVAGGQGDLSNELATLYVQMAVVHWSADDIPGALALYDRAIAIQERLVQQEGRGELANDLARTYAQKAVALDDLGASQAAVALCDRAIAIQERLVQQEGRGDLAEDLAKNYMNKGIALSDLGAHEAAVAFHDRAIAIMERLVQQEGRNELAAPLARHYMVKGNALGRREDKGAAVPLYDRAIAIHERLALPQPEWRRQLARSYQNKAGALSDLGDKRAAVALYDQAIEIFDQSVRGEGHRQLLGDLAWARALRAVSLLQLGETSQARTEGRQAVADLQEEATRTGRADLQGTLRWARKALRDVLAPNPGNREPEPAGPPEATPGDDRALTYCNKASAMRDLGDMRAAAALFDQALEIYERLVHQEARRELADKLALTYYNKASVLNALEDNWLAVELYSRAVEIQERLVHLEGRRELQGHLGLFLAGRAEALLALGDRQRAQTDARDGVAILQREVARTGRADLKDYFDWATTALKEVL